MKGFLKISNLKNGDEAPFETPAAYSLQGMSSGGARLVVGVPAGDPGFLLALLKELHGPLFILYVLHTPRGEAAPGRYQSPEVSVAQAEQFILQFGSFLTADARFDLWVHSPALNGTLVWDRHNQLYCYGPLVQFTAALSSLGFNEQPLPDFGPHIHHYRSEFDDQAQKILQYFQWSFSPLRPEDEQ